MQNSQFTNKFTQITNKNVNVIGKNDEKQQVTNEFSNKNAENSPITNKNTNKKSNVFIATMKSLLNDIPFLVVVTMGCLIFVMVLHAKHI